MNLVRSISGQLVVAFGAGLVAAIFVGLVGFGGARQIARDIAQTADDALPRVSEASALAATTARMQTEIVAYFRGAAYDPAAEARIDASLEAIADQAARIDSPAITASLDELSAELGAALTVHRDASELVFHFEGQRYSIVTFLEHLQVANADYLKSVSRAAKFGAFGKVQTDPARTDFARWAEGFGTGDATLRRLIGDYARAEAAMVAFMRDEIAGDPGNAAKKFMGMTSQHVPVVESALDALAQHAAAREAALSERKSEMLGSLRAGLEAFIAAASAEQARALGAMVRSVDQTQAQAARISRLVTLALVVAAVGTLAAGVAAVCRIGRPLAGIERVIHALNDKRFDAPICHTERSDEIGAIARAAVQFRDRLIESDRLAHRQDADRRAQADAVQRLGKGLTALAAGDLTQPIETAFAAEYEQLRHDFNATMSTLNEMLAAVVENATEIRGRAEEIAGASDDLSHRTETQAATLEETAAALDELTGSVRSAAEGAAEVEGVVRSARGDAEASGRVVSDAVDAMGEIKRSSDEISQIIGVIDDIAFQTNLLALNAGVEAARAGEAGRGFAVVASEVRALAQRSSEAAREIKELISASSGQVESGVALVNRAGEALSDIVGRVGNIADLVSEIATGAQEQSVGLGEINVGVTQLDQVTQQNAAMVEEATAASATLRHEAETLQGLVARFWLQGTAAPAVPLRLRTEKRRTDANGAAEHPRPDDTEPIEISFPAQKRAARGQIAWQDF
ncbi:Methyl-accepting chemotaxis protein [Rhodovulum sp. ES.010]|uniref:methyl-accepting chemotaxis protein n=1 Tax=Rhodovulum sp. ES.010 TaxID=1882821 RepID=UPI000925FBE0|nr:methyl-accepting chemotaxis protein [Rhodovulum sp. ES.010]SIO42520.1 Methyl-accepting chemotaxis protein [Rhodovulum sp. ES.010]